jgi:two-component system, response regulator PdtaR
VVAIPPKPYQLLVADDDYGFRETLKYIFEPYVQMLEADSGEEAIRIVEQRRVDIALLDMHMHMLTGLETLRIVKSINAEVPCILITADATEKLRRDASAADAYSVLAKPISKAELLTTVSTALHCAYDDPEALSWSP